MGDISIGMWLSLTIGPLVSIIIILAQNWASRRNNSEQIQVAAKEARTHEFEVLISGYKARVDDVEGALDEAKDMLRDAKEQMRQQAALTQELSERVKHLEQDVVVLEEDRTKLLQYVAILEAVLPQPNNIQKPDLSRQRKKP